MRQARRLSRTSKPPPSSITRSCASCCARPDRKRDHRRPRRRRSRRRTHRKPRHRAQWRPCRARERRDGRTTARHEYRANPDRTRSLSLGRGGGLDNSSSLSDDQIHAAMQTVHQDDPSIRFTAEHRKRRSTPVGAAQAHLADGRRRRRKDHSPTSSRRRLEGGGPRRGRHVDGLEAGGCAEGSGNRGNMGVAAAFERD